MIAIYWSLSCGAGVVVSKCRSKANCFTADGIGVAPFTRGWLKSAQNHDPSSHDRYIPSPTVHGQRLLALNAHERFAPVTPGDLTVGDFPG